MPLVPERLWVLMTPDEQATVNDVVEGWRYEPRFPCPHCGGGMAIKLKVTAGAFRIDAETGQLDKPAPPPQPAPPSAQDRADANFLDKVGRDGTLEAFADAVRVTRATGMPSEMGQYFLSFLRTLVKLKMPAVAAARMRQEWPEGKLYFRCAQGIVAVFVDDAIRQFVPQDMLIGVKTKGGVRVASGGDIERWVKGRFGYVPDGGAFSQAMSQRSVGAFGALVQ
jgi:hypothetical protein